jgi:hypothetical protein
MNEWMFSRLVDYWDHTAGSAFENGAVYRLSRALHGRSTRDLAPEQQQIARAVQRHVEALDDASLILGAQIFAEDLYKAASVMSRWDSAIRAFLEASGGTFCDQLQKRGYAIHYVIDNAFENTPVGMAGPIEWYPRWFRAAGLVYVCPQAVACMLMAEDGVPETAMYEQMFRYIREARAVAHDAVRHGQREHRHFVYLDTDGDDSSFGVPTEQGEQPGVILLFRRVPPIKGSKVVVVEPPGPR